jgi:hypothetical protein
MTERTHVSRRMLRRLAQHELSPREIAELLRHLGECEECARVSAAGIEKQLDALQAPIDGNEGPWHPDHADIAAYADGTAGPAEREIVASHLEDCALCREDAADLAKLRRTRPRRRAWRVAMATAAAIAAMILLVVLVQRNADRGKPTDPPIVTTQPPTAITAGPVPPLPMPPLPMPPLPMPPPPVPPRYANAEWERLVRTAVDSERLPFARGIGTAPEVLRGAGQTAPGQTAPDVVPAGVVIDETRPRFSWPARDGATYVVSIFSGDQPVARSEPLTETRWTPATPLARGRTYVWQVQATRGLEREIIPAPPAPPAMFRIVSRRDHDELAEARRSHPDDFLLHAVLAARAGLREEALRELSRAHTNIRPD